MRARLGWVLSSLLVPLHVGTTKEHLKELQESHLEEGEIYTNLH